MRISVFGLGYVGTVSCSCLGDLGHDVIGVDVNDVKVERIGKGESPIIEDGLDEIMAKVHAAGRISACTSADDAVRDSDLALVCVGTPSTPSGGVNDEYLIRVSEQIGAAVKKHDKEFFTILNRSTGLPYIHEKMQEVLEASSGRKMGEGIGYVCHPEFLREGVAVEDFYNPPKIVFGATDKKSEAICRELYPGIDAETFFVTPGVASMVKYADNCFHAAKVTFGNEIGMICKAMGIDSHAVMDIFCADRKLNISPRYLKPGFAYGGSCLPKDIRGILDGARQTATGLPMLSGIRDSNPLQIESLLKRIVSPDRPTVGILGLAFKEGTDDVRESPIVTLVERLCGKGHPVCIYDRYLSLANLVGENLNFALQSIPHLAELLTENMQDVVDRADIIVVSHRCTPEIWAGIKWRENQRVIDVINIPELHDVPGYDGLYW